MNEVENHYASVGGTSGHGTAESSRSESSKSESSKTDSTKPAEVAKAAIDNAVSAAKSTLRSAADTARGAVDDVRKAAGGHYGRASSLASDHYENVSRGATYARRRSAIELGRTRRNVESFVGENPIMVGVAGLAAGLLIGTLLPQTRQENEALGRYADEAREQALRYARELTEQGRHFVEEALDTKDAKAAS